MNGRVDNLVPVGCRARGDTAAFSGKRCAGHSPAEARGQLWEGGTDSGPRRLSCFSKVVSQPTPAFLLLHRGRSSPAPSQAGLLPALLPSRISAALGPGLTAEQKGRRQREVDVPSSISLRQLPSRPAWLTAPARRSAHSKN